MRHRLRKLGFVMRKYANAIRSRFYELKFKLHGNRPRHLVICGYSETGADSIIALIRKSTPDAWLPQNKETSALETPYNLKGLLITSCALDVFKIAEIEEKYSKIRDLFYIVFVDDPRNIVSAKDDYTSHQYSCGFDYQLISHPSGQSFSGPGVHAFNKEIECTDLISPRTLIIHEEDFNRNPDYIVKVIGFSTGFITKPSHRPHIKGCRHEEKRIDAYRFPNHISNDRPAWSKGDRYSRTLRQLRQFPELEEVVTKWGYPATSEVQECFGAVDIAEPVQRGQIVAFYTDDVFYAGEAARCRKRLEQIGLPHEFTCVPKGASWVENCARKPEFLLDVRKRLRGPLLYIDVDAFIHKDPWPYLMDYGGDMAAYVHQDGELISCTIFLNDTLAAVELLSKWVECQKRNPQVYDQKVLQDIIEHDEAHEKRYRFQRLPLSFSYISDKTYPYIHAEPFIEQLQASRVTKHGRRGEKMMSRVAQLDNLIDEQEN